MKKLLLTITVISFGILSLQAQKMKTISGSPKVIKGDKNVSVVFTYDNLKVGKMLEEDYIKKKVDEKEKKEAGKGKKWEVAWKQDRIDHFQPKFIELFNKHASSLFGTQINEKATNAKYTMRVNTSMIEPGFHVGVVRKPAYINMEIYIYETTNPSKILYQQTIQKIIGQAVAGFDFNSSFRIQEGFAKAGKATAKFMYKKHLK